jgi:cytochrome c oxidase subunit 2
MINLNLSTYLKDPVSFSMEGIIFFFKDTMTFVYVIGFFVSWVLYRCISIFYDRDLYTVDETKGSKGNFYFKQIEAYGQGIKHFTTLEIVWTVVPALILIVIAIPSFGLLYFLEEFIEPHLLVKVEGHQWYWHYYVKGSSKYFSFIDKNHDSYMIPQDSLKLGQLRLLEVDKRLVLPTKTHIQIVSTSVDVLHSWSVPSLGIKLDACPGRLNESMLYLRREGVFYGQCSEICGINHGFMPIVVKAISPDDFIVLGNTVLEG